MIPVNFQLLSTRSSLLLLAFITEQNWCTHHHNLSNFTLKFPVHTFCKQTPSLFSPSYVPLNKNSQKDHEKKTPPQHHKKCFSPRIDTRCQLAPDRIDHLDLLHAPEVIDYLLIVWGHLIGQNDASGWIYNWLAEIWHPVVIVSQSTAMIHPFAMSPFTCFQLSVPELEWITLKSKGKYAPFFVLWRVNSYVPRHIIL